ncbi:MAG: beta-ketoacyl-[acyl-carrier-protein] synthase family protein [Planctomycetota bacterium]|jgi:3-oxoacyl-[acyl-carrier-protein] synthase II
MTERVAITGMGIVSAIGSSADEVWASMEAGRSGLGRLTLFQSPRYGDMPVAEVKHDVAAASGLDDGSRSDHLAMAAARQASEEAGLDGLGEDELDRTGIVIGATVGGILTSAAFVEGLLRDGVACTDLLRFHECASSADLIAAELGTFGPCMTVSTACSSGSNAIGVACDMIASGEADIMLAGGTDSLSRFTLNGFGSLLLIDPEGCRPFDRNRNGMSLGEGAAVFVLESRASAARRGAAVRAWVSGWSNTCDAYHTTRPEPGGKGALRAMKAALARAGLGPADIQYVNAHGTGTKDNDAAEGEALRTLFGDDMPAVSSTKRFFGHTFGAAGAIEAMVAVLAAEKGGVPPNIGFSEGDPACGIEPVRDLTPAGIDNALSLSLGFGGNNSCLAVSRAGREA